MYGYALEILTLWNMLVEPHEGFVYQTRIKAGGQTWVRCQQTEIYPLEIFAANLHVPENTNNRELTQKNLFYQYRNHFANKTLYLFSGIYKRNA